MSNIKLNEKGYIGEIIAVIFILALFLSMFLSIFFLRFQTSQSVVSGIVYDTTNNNFISGNTTFCIRAGINTYVGSQTNQTCYCLPPHSPYINLINKAAQDKTIKVIVTSNPYIVIQSPFTCRANTKVVKE